MKANLSASVPVRKRCSLRFWWDAVPGEHFRMFFPLGIFASIVGVLLWPLYFMEVGLFYPGLVHARIMIFCFFGAFFVGFLGTAGPRMLGVAHLQRRDCLIALAIWLFSLSANATGNLIGGDFAILVGFIWGAYLAYPRIRKRQGLPLPSFVLILLGMVSGFAGILIYLLLDSGLPVPHGFVFNEIARKLTQESFLLLPILGVAPFFFPRFGGQGPSKLLEVPFDQWNKHALRYGGFGVVFISLQIIEVYFPSIAWGIVRIVMILVYGYLLIPFRFEKSSVGTLGRVIQIAMLLVVAGLVIILVDPVHATSLRHLFLGGFALITLSVGSWVTFGHSGVIHWGKSKSVQLRIAAGILLVALVTRVIADFFPDLRSSHLIYAAVAWIIGASVWGHKVFPRVFMEDDD